MSVNKNDLAEIIFNGTNLECNDLKFSILDWPDRENYYVQSCNETPLKQTTFLLK